MTQNLLLGIDLEDVRDQIPDGYRYRDRVEKNVDLLLDFLEEQGAHATFFTVGSLSRRLPAMVRRIHEQGHEVAAHGNTHTQLTKLTPETFSQDLSENLDCLTSVTGSGVSGFRAPTFSLVESSQWAYEILANQGIKYSSSVLAARACAPRDDARPLSCLPSPPSGCPEQLGNRFCFTCPRSIPPHGQSTRAFG